MLASLAGHPLGLARLAFPFLGPDTLSGAPLAVVLAVRLGLNLWLPAGVVLAAMHAIGLHRRVGAPATRGARWLALAWVAYVVLVALGPWMVWVSLVFGVLLLPGFAVLLCLGIWGATAEWRALRAGARIDDAPGWQWVALVGLAPPAVAIALLALGPGNPLASGLARNEAFERACESAGVQFLAKPASVASSIAYDASGIAPTVTRHGYYRLDRSGRITGYGGGLTHARRPPMRWTFTESVTRTGQTDAAPTVVRRAPGPGPGVTVDDVSADLLLKTVAQVLTFRPRNTDEPGLVAYTATLVDRRDGRELARMRYAVDLPERRGCGANDGDRIDPDSFVYDALHGSWARTAASR